MSPYSWPVIKAKLREAIVALPNFFRNPVQGMRQLPAWEWPELIILQGAFALGCATLKNIVDRDVIGLFVDIFVAPISAVVVIGFISLVFYYGFKHFHNRDVGLLPLYTNMVFAAIPFQVTNILSKYVAPINLVGLAASLLLLHVGLVHNFQVQAVRLKKWFIAIFSVFFLTWIVSMVNTHYKRDSMKAKFRPEDIKLLEEEMRPATDSDSETKAD